MALQVRQLNSILWPLRPRNARLDRREIELKHCAVLAFTLAWNSKHALCGEVASYCFDVFVGTASGLQIKAGLFVNGEKSHGRAILWRHVSDRGAVCN